MRTDLQRSTRTRVTRLVVAGAMAVALAACGGDDDDGEAVTPDPEDLAEDPQGAVDDLADDLQDQQDQQGGGSATLTIGGETWEFDSVLCAFGTEETRNEDWDFSLSAIQDGLQLSVSGGAEGGPYGDDITLDDIEDFENPSVSWSAPAFVLPSPENPTAERVRDFVEIDGKEISAEADFSDGTSDDPTASVPGTLSATCP